MYSTTGGQKYLSKIIDSLYMPRGMLSFFCIDFRIIVKKYKKKVKNIKLFL